MLKTQPIDIEVIFPSDKVPDAGITCNMQLMNNSAAIGANNEFILVKHSDNVWTYDEYYIKQNIELSDNCKNILQNAESNELNCIEKWTKSSYNIGLPTGLSSDYSFKVTLPEIEGLVGSYNLSEDYSSLTITYTYIGDLTYTGTWDIETIDGLDYPSSVTTNQPECNVFTFNENIPSFLVKIGNTFDLELVDTDDWWFDVVPNHNDLTFTVFARGYAFENKSTFKKYKTVEDADTEENGSYELIALKNIDIEDITLNNPLWINTDKWTIRAHSISANNGATIIVNACGDLDLDINKNVFVRNEAGGKVKFD